MLFEPLLVVIYDLIGRYCYGKINKFYMMLVNKKISYFIFGNCMLISENCLISS